MSLLPRYGLWQKNSTKLLVNFDWCPLPFLAMLVCLLSFRRHFDRKRWSQLPLSLSNSTWFLGWFLVAPTQLHIQADANRGTDSWKQTTDWMCLWWCRWWHGRHIFYPYYVQCRIRRHWDYFVAAPFSTVGAGLVLFLLHSTQQHYQQLSGISQLHFPAWSSFPIHQCHGPNFS